jgi:hypothetical protein
LSVLYDDELQGTVSEWLQEQDNDFRSFRDFFFPHEIGEAIELMGGTVKTYLFYLNYFMTRYIKYPVSLIT